MMTDNGSGGALTSTVSTDPWSSTTLEIPISNPSTAGTQVQYQLVAINAEGSTNSQVVAYIFATIPSEPSSPPNELDVDEEGITVSVDPLTGANTGGIDIIGYEIQMDDGRLGDFTTIQGADRYTLSTILTVSPPDIQQGLSYRFRYRAINQMGPGEWSDKLTVSAFVSSTPATPDAPEVTETGADRVLLKFFALVDNSSLPITGLELNYWDYTTPSTSTNITYSDYDGTLLSKNVTGLTNGNIYGFRVRIINDVSQSEFSPATYALAETKPSAPSSPFFNLEDIGRTYATIRWAQSSITHGYQLYVEKGGDNLISETLIYDGSDDPHTLSFTHQGLETGIIYNYYLKVVDYNGPSNSSSPLSITI
jgi:hypothetical protein